MHYTWQKMFDSVYLNSIWKSSLSFFSKPTLIFQRHSCKDLINIHNLPFYYVLKNLYSSKTGRSTLPKSQEKGFDKEKWILRKPISKVLLEAGVKGVFQPILPYISKNISLMYHKWKMKLMRPPKDPELQALNPLFLFLFQVKPAWNRGILTSHYNF